MKRLAFLAALLAALFVTLPATDAQLPPVKQIVQAKVQHGRGHKEPKTPAQKAARLALHLSKYEQHKELHKKLRAMDLPTSWDSRTQGWIPPIVDQGQCLPGDTPILMADGSWKRIELLKVGDVLVTPNNRVAKVTSNEKRWVDEQCVLFKALGYELLITNLHPVLTEDGYRRAEQLGIGQNVHLQDRLVILKGDETLAKCVSPITHLEKKRFKGFVWSLEVDGDHAYIANHIGVHNCGSCWDFSGTTICTTAFMIAQGANAPGPLSEQYTLDCGQNGGCDGDDNTTVLAWAKATGLPTTAAYGPYTQQAGRCKSPTPTLYKITDWGYATPSNTNAPAACTDICVAIMTYGSVGCGIDASSDAFSNYTSGVFTISASSNIDHDIALVAFRFDVSAKTQANPLGCIFTLRNSWGTSWGMLGYMDISYGSAGVGWEAVWATAGGPPVPPVPPTPPTPPVPVPPTPPTPTPGVVTLTLTPDQVASVIQQSGAVTITGDMTVRELMEALDKCKKPTQAAPPLRMPAGPKQDKSSLESDVRDLKAAVPALIESQKAVIRLLIGNPKTSVAPRYVDAPTIVSASK